MPTNYSCPKCHHTDLHLHAVVTAVLHSCKDDSGVVQLSQLQWDEIEYINSYECLNCGYKFNGDECV